MKLVGTVKQVYPSTVIHHRNGDKARQMFTVEYPTNKLGTVIKTACFLAFGDNIARWTPLLNEGTRVLVDFEPDSHIHNEHWHTQLMVLDLKPVLI